MFLGDKSAKTKLIYISIFIFLIGIIGLIGIFAGSQTNTATASWNGTFFNTTTIDGGANVSLDFFSLGDGSDGALTVSASNTYVNNYTTVNATNISAGATTFNVVEPGNFSVGDEILIIQMINDSGGTAGRFEFKNISAITGGQITVTTSFTYSYKSGKYNVSGTSTGIGGANTQVIRVPQYTSVTVNSGGEITAPVWDGWTGGIVVFRATGTILVNGGGLINASNKGYRGGISFTGDDGANGGESTRGLGGARAGTGASTAGGGGSGGDASAGVGGSGVCGGGGGGRDTAGTGSTCTGGAGAGSGYNSGGGGGGHGTWGLGALGVNTASRGQNGSFIKSGDGGGGDATQTANGGGGGQAYGGNTTEFLFFGSGGGGSTGTASCGQCGRGGGIILVYGNNITIKGVVNASGETTDVATGGSGAPGAGAGGTVFLNAMTADIGTNNISSEGGLAKGGLRGSGHGGKGVAIVRYVTSLSGSADIVASSTNMYSGIGSYLQSVDAGQIMKWDNVTWNNFSVANTVLNLKVRSCDDSACSGETFVGEQNTAASNFTSSPALLNTSITPNNRYFQVNVSFVTSDTSKTPVLEDLTVEWSSANSAPTINITSPLNNSRTNNNTIIINKTITDVDNNLDACWWTNNTGKTNITFTCANNITGQTWLEGVNNITIYANDTAGLESLSRVTFTVDTINPATTWTFPANDNSSRIKANTSMNIQISDTNLYQVELNISNATGSTIRYNLTSDINSSTAFTISDLFVNNVSSGNYTVRVYASDMHTKKVWNIDANITTYPPNKIGFYLNNKDAINISVENLNPSSGNSIVGLTTEKLTDRYIFNLTLNKATTSMDIRVDANKIVYFNNSGYQGHIIINDKYWFDTEPYLTTLKEQGSGYIILTVNGNSKYFNFNSLGGLNTVTEYRKFELDVTAPVLSNSVTNQSIVNNKTLVNFVVDVVDAISGPNSVWLQLKNVATNVWDWFKATFVSGNQWGIDVNINDTHNESQWWANDTIGNNATLNANFPTIDYNPPNITIRSPNVRNSTNTIVVFNISAFDDGQVSSCWATINNGITNLTLLNSTATSVYNATNSSVPDGNYIARFYCNDTLNKVNNTESYAFTIDTIAPSVVMQNFTSGANSSFSQTLTITEINIDRVLLNDTTYFNTTNAGVITNRTNLSRIEIHYLNMTINDTSGNKFSRMFYINITADTVYPLFANYTNNPANNSAYSLSNIYSFNSTINNTNGSVGFEFNGTNYTAGNLTTLFSVNITNISAGNYSYKWWGYGNGSVKNFNVSEIKHYTIAKATGNVAGYIGGTRANRSVDTQTTTMNFSANRLAGETLIYLNLNGTTINGTEWVSNTTNIGVGTYQMNVSINVSQNYTSYSESWTLTVTQYVAPPGGGGGGGPTYEFKPTDYLCTKTYYFILNNHQNTEDLIQEIWRETGKTESSSNLNMIINNWQGLCSGRINKTLEPQFVCEEIFYFTLRTNYNYTTLEYRDLSKVINDKIKVSDSLLSYYQENYDDVCKNYANELPTKPESIWEIFLFPKNTTTCNISTGWEVFNWNFNIPVWDSNWGTNVSCKTIDRWRWWLALEDRDGSLYVGGIKWWEIFVLVIGLIVITVIGIRKIKKTLNRIENQIKNI